MRMWQFYGNVGLVQTFVSPDGNLYQETYVQVGTLRTNRDDQ